MTTKEEEINEQFSMFTTIANDNTTFSLLGNFIRFFFLNFPPGIIEREHQ